MIFLPPSANPLASPVAGAIACCSLHSDGQIGPRQETLSRIGSLREILHRHHSFSLLESASYASYSEMAFGLRMTSTEECPPNASDRAGFSEFDNLQNNGGG